MTQSARSLEGKLAVYDNLSDYIAFSQSLAQVVGHNYDSIYDMYEQIDSQLDPMLQSLQYFHEEVLRVTIYSENCQVDHDVSLAALEKVEDEPWFELAMNSSSGCWYVDAKEKTAVSVRRMPLLEKLGTTGLLYISIDYDSLFDGFEEIPRSDYELLITESDGTILYSAGKREDSQGSVLVFEEPLGPGWKIRFIQSKKEFEGSLRPLRYLAMMTSVLCTAGAGLIFVFVSLFVTRRIHLLTKRMQAVESGDLEIEVPDDPCSDEIGMLTKGFGEMLERIRVLIREVYGSKLAQKEYEMKALQNQINPHFLYNTLSMINWKALEAGEQDISRVTLALSTFYRTSLNKGKNVLKLKEEINNIRSYLEIQLMMHDHSFDVVYEIDGQLLEYESLNLILQPLVENAIEHGIDQLTDRRGTIWIRGRLEDGCVVLEVEDNGIGMDNSHAMEILGRESKGYGVRNVNERIRLYYGAQYAMEIFSEPGRGTTCRLHFPAVFGNNK